MLDRPLAEAAKVTLSSSRRPILKVPATVSIPAGATEVDFRIVTAPVGKDVVVILTASFNGGGPRAECDRHALETV